MCKKIISHYENHIDYIEKNISITSILSCYCKYNNIKDLLNFKDFKNIIKEYKIHFQYEMEEDDVVDIDDSDHDIYKFVSLSSSNISSNYYSDPSDEESQNNNNINLNNSYNDNDRDDEADKDGDNNEKYIKNKK